jgi:hypothetical protein
MARIIVLGALAAIFAGCASTDQAAQRTGGLEPQGLSASGAPLGRDNPVATYTQPNVGPERRVEPPPVPQRR